MKQGRTRPRSASASLPVPSARVQPRRLDDTREWAHNLGLPSSSSFPLDARVPRIQDSQRIMFELFTFGARAHTAIHQREDELSTSPTDCSFSNTLRSETSSSSYRNDPQQGGIGDIVNQFSHYSLAEFDESETPQQSIWHGRTDTLPTPDFETTMSEFSPEEMSYISTIRDSVLIPRPCETQPKLSPRRLHLKACRRLQRQINAQLQTSSSHLEDVNALVEGLIETSPQFRLHDSCAPPPRQQSRSPGFEELQLDPSTQLGDNVDDHRAITPDHDEDEGFVEMDDLLAPVESLRRTSTPAGIRKFKALRMRAGLEGLENGGVVIDSSGRVMVRCHPRMRRRDREHQHRMSRRVVEG